MTHTQHLAREAYIPLVCIGRATPDMAAAATAKARTPEPLSDPLGHSGHAGLLISVAAILGGALFGSLAVASDTGMGAALSLALVVGGCAGLLRLGRAGCETAHLMAPRAPGSNERTPRRLGACPAERKE